MQLSLGRRIKAARALVGISQNDFAYFCGIGKRIITRFEANDDITKNNKKIIVKGINDLGIVILCDGVRFRTTLDRSQSMIDKIKYRHNKKCALMGWECTIASHVLKRYNRLQAKEQMHMTDKPLTEFFDTNIAPQFITYGWSSPEINALRGSFIMGAKFALENCDNDDSYHLVSEIEDFEAQAAVAGTDH